MSSTQDVRASGAALTSNARVTINCGFKPAVIEAHTDAQGTSLFWNAGMANDAMLTVSGAVRSYITSSGIQLVDDGTNIGFSIGPDTQFKATAGDEIFWSALRGHDPK